ncbi:MAG: hypothetical protein QXH26_01360 [Candidatus Hadarchaeales archaeon]
MKMSISLSSLSHVPLAAEPTSIGSPTPSLSQTSLVFRNSF